MHTSRKQLKKVHGPGAERRELDPRFRDPIAASGRAAWRRPQLAACFASKSLRCLQLSPSSRAESLSTRGSRFRASWGRRAFRRGEWSTICVSSYLADV